MDVERSRCDIAATAAAARADAAAEREAQRAAESIVVELAHPVRTGFALAWGAFLQTLVVTVVAGVIVGVIVASMWSCGTTTRKGATMRRLIISAAPLGAVVAATTAGAATLRATSSPSSVSATACGLWSSPTAPAWSGVAASVDPSA